MNENPGESVKGYRKDTKGLNQSIALSRADAKVYHAGAVGKNGEQLKQLLDEILKPIAPLGQMFLFRFI